MFARSFLTRSERLPLVCIAMIVHTHMLTLQLLFSLIPFFPECANKSRCFAPFYLFPNAHLNISSVHGRQAIQSRSRGRVPQSAQHTGSSLISLRSLCSNGSLFQVLGRSQSFCAFQFLLVCSFVPSSSALFFFSHLLESGNTNGSEPATVICSFIHLFTRSVMLQIVLKAHISEPSTFLCWLSAL